jgi:methyl-accepting chemotaxis protein
MPTIAGRRIRLGLTLKLVIVADAAILGMYFFFLLYALPVTSENTMQERTTRVERQARMACDILQYNYGLEAAGAVTGSEAQARALDEVNSLGSSSGGVDDVWVLDDGPVLLAGTTMSGRVGTNVGDIEDSEGEAVFARMVGISRSEGDGTYRYSWQAGGGSGSVATVASVKSFQPWGWTVSVSTSVQGIGSRSSGVNSTLGWIGGAVAVASIILFWLIIRAVVIRPLFSLKQTSQALVTGDVDQQIKVKTDDELGDMAAAYSEVIDYMKEMAGITTKIADGDLTVPIRPRSEKDVLSHSFSRMVARQRELIGGVKRAAAEVAEASENLSKASEQTARVTQQIAATIQQVAKGTSEQSACLQEVVTSEGSLSKAIETMASGSQEQAASAEEAARMVKQVSVSATQVWQNAQAGTEAWKSTAKSAEGGARTTYETVEGMKKIKEAIDQVSLRVADLGARSHEIGSIVATIDDIAAQTNLLALNAAIEAARAGDQGRGFAVVADEVRKLAERSSIATKEIASLIGSMQTGVSDAVKAMERGSREVESGYGLAGEAGKALDDILESSQAVGKQVNQITAAAEELNALSKNMVNVIQQISRTIEENAAATEAMAASSSNVSTSISSVGIVAEENSASAEEVSASVEEMSASVEEVLASAQGLAEMAAGLKGSVAAFKTED